MASLNKDCLIASHLVNMSTGINAGVEIQVTRDI